MKTSSMAHGCAHALSKRKIGCLQRNVKPKIKMILDPREASKVRKRIVVIREREAKLQEATGTYDNFQKGANGDGIKED